MTWWYNQSNSVIYLTLWSLYILGNRFLEASISLHGKILFLALIISAQNTFHCFTITSLTGYTNTSGYLVSAWNEDEYMPNLSVCSNKQTNWCDLWSSRLTHLHCVPCFNLCFHQNGMNDWNNLLCSKGKGRHRRLSQFHIHYLNGCICSKET